MAGLSGGFSWLALAVGRVHGLHGQAGANRLKHNTLVLLCKRIDYQWVSLLSPRGGDKITAHRVQVVGQQVNAAGCMAADRIHKAVPNSMIHNAVSCIVPRVFHALHPALFHDRMYMFHVIYPLDNQCIIFPRHINVTH